MGLLARTASATVLAAMAMAGMASTASAEEANRLLKITGNFSATSDYVFRGFSQSAENPTVQGGVDVTYKWFYAGLWASGIDFGQDASRVGRDIAHIEIDYYAGIKPVVGKLTFDLGIIYYTYPRAFDIGGAAVFRELDYVELKAGVSGDVWKDGTLGVTFFYSPEYTNDTGAVWTVEGTFAQVLPKFGEIVPTFSALLGFQQGDNARYIAAVGNGSDNYMYWNVGLALGFGDRFSLDFRYWDTNVSNTGGFCSGATFQCDERFIATAKVTY